MDILTVQNKTDLDLWP